MKHKFIKFFKIISVIFLLSLIILIIAILWPIPKLDSPKKFETVFIKSITIIDVESGNLLENRDILIKNNKIIALAELTWN